MKKTLFIFVALVFLFSLVSANDVIKREFDVNKGETLTLMTEIGGDIYIKGHDKDKIEIKAEVYRIDKDDYDIDFDPDKSGLMVDVDKRGGFWKGNNGKIDFTVIVPKEFNIEIETSGGPVNIENIKGNVNGRTSGGSLDFGSIEGNIDFRTMGGSIAIEKITGHLDLKTMGGSISVRDSRADGEVKTMGGSIRIENVDGDLDGSTMGGSVTYRNVTGRSSTSNPEPLHLSTMGGSIEVDQAPNGAKLDTQGGSIEVNKAGNFVEAETMGGSIVIREIDGRVDASTMGGSVEVNMVGDPDKGNRDVYISSKGGSIDLTVPRGLSMNFDIELAQTKDAKRDYDIYSDFDIDKKKTDNWEGSWGSKKKYVYGTGQYKGGKNKIKIETVNGDIHIKEGAN
jgi:DUF4097 and DUF4098 domain-containing protein YvlB